MIATVSAFGQSYFFTTFVGSGSGGSFIQLGQDNAARGDRAGPVSGNNLTVGHGVDDELKVGFPVDAAGHDVSVRAGFSSGTVIEYINDIIDSDTEGSRYTLRDTPIFTCLRKSLKETVDTLGG